MLSFFGTWAYLAAWLGNVSNDGLLLLAALFWAGSLALMYVDVRSLSDGLADRSPGTWVLGAVLLYPGVMPIYIFDRLRVLAS